jgi:hypothetical protein
VTEFVLLTAVRSVVFLLGVTITGLAARAYRRRGTRYLRDAAVGFGILTAGVFVEGLLFQVADLPLETVHVIESLAIGLAFLVLLRSFLR